MMAIMATVDNSWYSRTLALIKKWMYCEAPVLQLPGVLTQKQLRAIILRGVVSSHGRLRQLCAEVLPGTLTWNHVTGEKVKAGVQSTTWMRDSGMLPPLFPSLQKQTDMTAL